MHALRHPMFTNDRLPIRSDADTGCCHTQEVDMLLQLWDKAWEGLARAEARYEHSGKHVRPRHTVGARCNCFGGADPRALHMPSGLAVQT